MIGNDIVDLFAARRQNNWQRRGWLQKIFTEEEQWLISNSNNPELLVWQFWSMKEAAYKAHQRRFNLSPRYNPKNFHCTLKNKLYADSECYITHTQACKQYIYSIASVSGDSYNSLMCKNCSTNNAQITQELSKVFKETVYITKDANRIPVMRIKSQNKGIPLSITHHGRYTAIAYIK